MDGTTQIAWTAGMARASQGPPIPSPYSPPTGSLPRVRLELRHANARPTVHELGDVGFLIGSVPGCDLRLPGVNLPPVLCLISRQAEGVSLRKLVPVLPVLINGQPVTGSALADGDRITLGAIDLLVHVGAVQARKAAPLVVEGTADERESKLRELAEELETDRAIWYRRREQVEQECKQQAETAAGLTRQLQQQERNLAAARAEVTEREQALRVAVAELDRRHSEAGGQGEEREEVAKLRRELAGIRQQLYDRYRERRDRLAGVKEAVRRAARKVQERKQQLDAEVAQFAVTRRDEAELQRLIDARAGELARERQQLDDRQRLLDERQEKLQRELTSRLADCQERERKLTEEKLALEQGRTQHQADLVRLDRLEAVLDKRQKQLQATAKQVDHRFEQLQRDTRELEDQARQLDALRAGLLADQEALEARRSDDEKRQNELNQRAVALEGQQAMLATLRTRLERLREEVRSEEARLADQRSRQEEAEADLRGRVEEAMRLRTELDAENQSREADRRRFEERRTVLDQAVAQLRQVQDTLAGDEAKLRQREEALDARSNECAEELALVRGKAEQVEDLQRRLAADRQALAERETAIVKSEQAVTALQEQLRRRADELTSHQKAFAERETRQAEAAAALQVAREELQRQQVKAEEDLAALRTDLEARTAAIAEQRSDLERREASLGTQVAELQGSDRSVAEERRRFDEARRQWEEDQRLMAADLDGRRAELEAARREAIKVQGQLPDLQQRVQTAKEKLAQARATLREHLAEVHAYAHQSRADLEGFRAQIRAEAERIHQQDLGLHKAREDHRLAVAAFRQQLLDWQSQVAELKQSLAQGETRLERRKAEVDEQARRIDTTTQALARQAEQLNQEQRVVTERRSEMERHLADMREWYRRKLRELAGVTSDDDTMPPAPRSQGATAERDILSLTGDIAPGDRQLGDLLHSLRLVDAATLTALLVEARRQRRSLRQLLLAGGYLSLYQVALIEAGNLDGLVLGPLRVVDRLRVTAHEAVYRVFDPRHDREAVLRHLAEANMHEPARPDAFRQRFGQAIAVRHPNVAATLEVLEILGRPAALLEPLGGTPSSDWPPLAAVPGVWYRLLSQAALGLHTIHQAGLVHGHLDSTLVLLAESGTVKLCGLGEPAWLVGLPDDGSEPTVSDDLTALGRLAEEWLALGGETKHGKSRPLPDELLAVLHTLTGEADGYPSAAGLLEALDAAGSKVPANGTAWERFVKQTREQTGDAKATRRSA